MSNKKDLPMSEIYRLKKVEGHTYQEIIDELELDCHKSTLSRRYRSYEPVPFEHEVEEAEEIDLVFDEKAFEAAESYSEGLEGRTDAEEEEYFAPLADDMPLPWHKRLWHWVIELF